MITGEGVVGWAMSDRITRQLAFDALTMALAHRQPAHGRSSNQGVYGLGASSEPPPPLASIEILAEMMSGPARNRTANPLIKSPLENTTTADHRELPLGISEDYEP